MGSNSHFCYYNKNKLNILLDLFTSKSKGFSLFSRTSSQQRLMPILYQWFKIYYQILLNKFSIIMHDSFQMISDVDHLMSDKIELYNKLLVFIKKFSPSVTGLILDSNQGQVTNFKGVGYEMLFLNENKLPERNSFHIIFIYPNSNEIEKHSKNLIMLISSEFEQRFKYHFEAVIAFFFTCFDEI